MLSDVELGETAGQLADIQLAQHKHHTDLSFVLDNYTALLESYRRLKSDFEEERDARERYKQIARGQERNPFVLVLVDADEYVFDDDLISNGTEGGARAAKMLLEMVQRSLRQKQLEHCRVMVRCYANVTHLSKTLSKLRLCGPEKRALAPFVASFNRSADLVDFVDVGEFQDKADFKLRAMFRLHAENAQCKQIYFAACHDTSYISDLNSFTGSRDRITLVRGTALHPEFNKLNFRIEDFSNLFRSELLDTNHQVVTQKATTPASVTIMGTPEPSISLDISGGRVCNFFQKGHCKYGKACKNSHVKTSNSTTQSYAISTNIMEISNWRRNVGQSNGSNSPPNTPSPEKDHWDLATSQTDAACSRKGSARTQAYLKRVLPVANAIPEGHVPVNDDQHRIDTYVEAPSKEDFAAFYAITAKRKLCNNYHIRGECKHGEDCTFDHSETTPEVLQALRSWARELGCPKGGACRSTRCIKGHICQKSECRYRGGNAMCKLPATAHTQNLRVVAFVAGDTLKAKHYGNQASNAVGEEEDLISIYPASEQPADSISDPAEVVAVKSSNEDTRQPEYEEW